jgi:DNA-binding HxlR family transcriptional regulator
VYRSHCALANFLDIFGDKWSLIIIRDMFLKKKSFNDFLISPEGIASNILTNRLKSLMKDDLIDYKISPSNKKVKWYYLKDKAADCYPILMEMVNWSSRNLSETFGPESLKWIKENKSDNPKTLVEKKILDYKKFRQQIFDNSLDQS